MVELGVVSPVLDGIGKETFPALHGMKISDPALAHAYFIFFPNESTTPETVSTSAQHSTSVEIS
jgi:phage tail protein X